MSNLQENDRLFNSMMMMIKMRLMSLRWGQFQQDLMIIFGFYHRPFRSKECHGYSALNLWKIDTKIRHTKTLRWVYEHHCIPVDEMSDLRLTWWKIIRSQANLHQENCILGHEVQSNNKKLHSERRYNKPRDSMIIEPSFRVHCDGTAWPSASRSFSKFDANRSVTF